MKCPMCNGSGKCYEQKIRYQEIETNRTDFTLAKCHKCNGTGEVEQTNEEWLRSATFEEMAGTIYEWYSQGHIEGKFGKQLSSATRVVEWLKQPHTIKE